MLKHQICSFFVDPQQGFTPLCPNELPVPGGDEIVPELLAMQDSAGVHIASGDEHPANANYFATPAEPALTPAPTGVTTWDVRWPRHCVAGTQGAELLPGLPKKTDYDFYVTKGHTVDHHPYGACYHDLDDQKTTGAIEFIKSKGVLLVLVGGLATDYCVKTTVLQLLKANLNVLVNKAACRGITDKTSEAAFDEMQSQGAVIVENAQQIQQWID